MKPNRHKSVPRVRATPRQIRDIKPKRQLPRTQRVEEDSWWEEADATNTTTGASSASNHVRKEGTNPILKSEQEISSDDKQGKWKQCQIYCREWYQGTSFTKKLKQFFWIFILYRTWKIIYAIDLEEYSSPSSIEMKSRGKSFFSAGQDDLYSPKASSLGGYGYTTESKNGWRGSSMQSKMNEPYYLSMPSNMESMPKSDGGVYQRVKKIIQSLFSSGKKVEVQAYQPSQSLQSLGSINSRGIYNNNFR